MKNKETTSEASYNEVQNAKDHKVRNSLAELMEISPVPKEEYLQNLGLFMDRRSLSRYLFIHQLYQKILDVHGVIFEFGVRFGQNLSLFTSFRGILEPFNHNRKIVGFDTFEGFPSVHKKDGAGHKEGDFAVPEKYEDYLDNLLQVHEQMAPIPSVKKFELVKGDVSLTLPEYLERNQQTIVSLAYFDLDIYQPTLDCLKNIKPYLTKGSVLVFDELNDANWPGETVALREAFGLNNFKICRSPYRGTAAYLVFE